MRSASGTRSTPLGLSPSWSGPIGGDVAGKLVLGTSWICDVDRLASNRTSSNVCSTSDTAENSEDGDAFREDNAEHAERGEVVGISIFNCFLRLPS